ncbi:MAG: amidohydrolase [Pseudomonadota bacterium]
MSQPRLILSQLIIITVLTLTTSHSQAETEKADLVLSNGKIYTMNPEQPWAESVAIGGGRILAVGTDEALASYAESASRTINLEQQMLLPAFQDVHIHPMTGGLAYLGCSLFGIEEMDAVLEKISQCVKEAPEADFIRGDGWDWGLFIGVGAPHKKYLDAIDDTRPLIFGDADGHTLWINSAALALAEIDADTIDPDGGEITREKDSKEPTGVLLEGPAMDLLNNKLPPPTLEQKKAALLYTQKYLHSLGITAMQDAFVGLTGTDSAKSLEAYQSLLDEDKLKLRVKTALYWEPGQGLDQIKAMQAARETYSQERLQVNAVKFWADGILEAYTAKLLEPYSDKPETTGLLMVPEDEIMAAIPLLDAAQFQVHIHTIGDATVRYALDAVELAQKNNGVRDARHLTAHTQLVDIDDIKRFAELDVIATFSPYWAYYDDYSLEINPPQLGAARMQRMYPIQELIEAGTTVSFGSDWSVSSADPLLGIETAVSRKDPHAPSELVFFPEQRVSLHDAIAGYTINAAYTNFLETETGSVEVGKYADLVILDQNLFDIPVAEISDAKVQATLLEGELVYGALD